MKRALITGGNSPIGAAICQELASMGFHIIVHGRIIKNSGVMDDQLDWTFFEEFVHGLFGCPSIRKIATGGFG